MSYLCNRTLFGGRRGDGSRIIYRKGEVYDDLPKGIQKGDFTPVEQKKTVKKGAKKVETAAKKTGEKR